MSPDPLDSPPADHGSDRYGYVEVQNAPEGVNPPNGWVDDMLANACLDCNPNLFIEWKGAADQHELRSGAYVDSNGQCWDVTVAHDQTCPTPHLPKETT